MRSVFILILVLVFNFSVQAQMPADRQLFTDATALAGKGRHAEALAKYRAISTGENTTFAARVRYNIGVCLYQLGRADEAVAEYAAAIELDPKYQKAYYALGMAQVALTNTHEAKFAFQKALELTPKDAEAWFDLAMVLLGEKDYDSAAAAFENAVANNSVNAPDALNNLGVIAALGGDIEKAKEKFKNAWAMSRGTSHEAIANFNICVQHERKTNFQFTARLKFSSNKKYLGE